MIKILNEKKKKLKIARNLFEIRPLYIKYTLTKIFICFYLTKKKKKNKKFKITPCFDRKIN